MTDPTPNRPADEPGLDEILQKLCDTVFQHGQATRTHTPFHSGEPKKEAEAQLLRWHTAEVRAMLERLKTKGFTQAIPVVHGGRLVTYEVVPLSVIDAELDKLKGAA
jgi:hypothetical protein